MSASLVMPQPPIERWRLALPPLMWFCFATVLAAGTSALIALDGLLDIKALMFIFCGAVMAGVGVGSFKSIVWWVGPCQRTMAVENGSLMVRRGGCVETVVPLTEIVNARFGTCLSVGGVIIAGGTSAPRLLLFLRDDSKVSTKGLFIWDQHQCRDFERQLLAAAREEREKLRPPGVFDDSVS